jgi:hypothetical protein
VTLDLVPTTKNGITNDNSGTAVVVQANNNIIATGFSSFNLTTSFTTPNFLENGSLNSTAFAVDSLFPGIAFTVFLPVQTVIGNGVPTFLGGGISTVAPEILEALRAPLLPVIPEIAHEGPIITREFQPQLSGIASPNALMTMFLGDIPLASTTADMAGAWSVVLPPLLEGSYTVTALATDPITGLSLASVGVPLTITTQAPSVPIIESPIDGDRITQPRVELRGRADPNSVVRLFTQDGVLGKVQASPTGLWSLQTERLPDGEYAVIAVATDTVGSSSLPSEVVTFYIEAEAQLRPRILTPERSLVSKQMSVRMTGSASQNSTILILVNDKERAKLKVSKEGTWSYTLSQLAPGNYAVTAATRDRKLQSLPLNITIEAEEKRSASGAAPPASPPSTGLINGVADPFSSISIYIDDAYFGKTMANSKGMWSFTPLRNQRLAPGKHTIAAHALDGTGSIVKKDVTIS